MIYALFLGSVLIILSLNFVIEQPALEEFGFYRENEIKTKDLNSENFRKFTIPIVLLIVILTVIYFLKIKDKNKDNFRALKTELDPAEVKDINDAYHFHDAE